MSLIAWYPLNGDLRNQGLENITVSGTAPTYENTSRGKALKMPDTTKQTFACDALSGAKVFSFAFWGYHKIDASFTTNWQDIVGFQDEPEGGGTKGNLRVEGSWGSAINYTFSIHDNGSYNISTLSGIPILVNNNADSWHHIVFTTDGIKCLAYVDGVLKGSSDSINGGHLTGTFWINTDNNFRGYISDFRVYNHCLSQKEVTDLARGLIVHYPMNRADGVVGGRNLGNTSTTYSNQTLNTALSASSWGGDAGTITYYSQGGYNNLPYKVVHKTATGTGGIYRKTANDITLEANTTYTMSVWVKSNRTFSESAYSFNINRGTDNHYINYGASVPFTTDWVRLTKTFTTTSDEAGDYGEMSIIYDDDVADYYVYYSGFKIEKGDIATPWTPGNMADTLTIYDSSGFGNHASYLSDHKPEWSSDTKIGLGSFNFNGTTVDGTSNTITGADFITAPLTMTTPSAITVAWWGKINKYARGGIFETTAATSSLHMATDYNTTAIANWDTTFRIYNGSSSVNIYSNIKQIGAWHHNVITFDGANVKYYRDGALIQTGALTGTLPTFNGFKIGMGRAGGVYRQIQQQMCDFRIYTTAIDATAVKELYQTRASIDNLQNVYSDCFGEEMENLLFDTNLDLLNNNSTTYATALWTQQANCVVTRENNKIHIYRPPNKTPSADGNTMWGGLIIKPAALYQLIDNHSYVIMAHITGKSSNRIDMYWSNEAGWTGGGYGMPTSPTNVYSCNIPTEFDGEQDIFYAFTISDGRYKTCTKAYSNFAEGSSYDTYRDFKIGFNYTNTGTLGSDIYIDNIRLYDITNFTNKSQFTAAGIAKALSFSEYNKAQIEKYSINGKSLTEL